MSLPVAQALAVLVARHESLRTVFDREGPTQRVLESGQVTVTVYEVEGDETEFVGSLVVRLLGEPFDIAADLPVRGLVVTRDGVAFIAVLLLSHAAVDAASAAMLGQQCADLLDGAGEDVPAGHQPLDQAEWEHSLAGERRTAASLRHWEASCGQRRKRCSPSRTPRARREVRMLSAALAAALGPVVARTEVGASAVVLAAGVGLLAAHTGADPGTLVSISGNRFRSGWRDYIGPLAQDALVSYAVAGSGGFGGLARHMQSAAFAAYRYARFDSGRLWVVIDAVGHERGTRFHRDCVFNDLGVVADIGPADDLPATRLEPMFDRPLPTSGVRIRRSGRNRPGRPRSRMVPCGLMLDRPRASARPAGRCGVPGGRRAGRLRRGRPGDARRPARAVHGRPAAAAGS